MSIFIITIVLIITIYNRIWDKQCFQLVPKYDPISYSASPQAPWIWWIHGGNVGLGEPKTQNVCFSALKMYHTSISTYQQNELFLPLEALIIYVYVYIHTYIFKHAVRQSMVVSRHNDSTHRVTHEALPPSGGWFQSYPHIPKIASW